MRHPEYKRAEVALLFDTNWTNAEIARLTGIAANTIGDWRRLHNQGELIKKVAVIDQKWRLRAACDSSRSPAYFTTHSTKPDDVACPGCPVRTQCRDAAIAVGEQWGVWGGHDFSTVQGRREARAEQKQQQQEQAE